MLKKKHTFCQIYPVTIEPMRSKIACHLLFNQLLTCFFLEKGRYRENHNCVYNYIRVMFIPWNCPYDRGILIFFNTYSDDGLRKSAKLREFPRRVKSLSIIAERNRRFIRNCVLQNGSRGWSAMSFSTFLFFVVFFPCFSFFFSLILSPSCRGRSDGATGV